MTRKLLLIGALGVVSVFAQNVRPVAVGPAPFPEASLQTILDSIYGPGVMNANTDQSTAGFWLLPGAPPQATIPILQAVYAATGSAVGIFSDPSTRINIFNASATAGESAGVMFNSNGTMTIFSGSCGDVNCGTFNGINQNGFGFYLDTGSNVYYTLDSLNGGVARALAYQQVSTDRWAVAFEDGSDFDYNDRVISLESILPVPEPGAVMLFGTVVALCATRLRRRQKA